MKDLAKRPASGLAQFGLWFGILSGGYLLLVLLIHTMQVTWGSTPVLHLAYRLCALAYLFGTFFVGVKTLRKKHIALLVALPAALLWLFATFVIGMNFHFMIGGSI